MKTMKMTKEAWIMMNMKRVISLMVKEALIHRHLS